MTNSRKIYREIDANMTTISLVTCDTSIKLQNEHKLVTTDSLITLNFVRGEGGDVGLFKNVSLTEKLLKRRPVNQK